MSESNPKLSISYEMSKELPIQAFDFIFVVEPDQEEWMPNPEDEKQQPIWDAHQEMIDLELNPDVPRRNYLDNIDYSKEPKFIWLPWPFQGGLYIDWIIDEAELLFRFHDPEEIPPNLKIYLEALYQLNPDIKFAVIGGMFEKEVDLVGKFVAEIGFETTILARYCISGKGFVNLDILFANMSDWQKSQEKLLDGDVEDEPSDQ